VHAVPPPLLPLAAHLQLLHVGEQLLLVVLQLLPVAVPVAHDALRSGCQLLLHGQRQALQLPVHVSGLVRQAELAVAQHSQRGGAGLELLQEDRQVLWRGALQ
jgi:hypothetical protein